MFRFVRKADQAHTEYTLERRLGLLEDDFDELELRINYAMVQLQRAPHWGRLCVHTFFDYLGTSFVNRHSEYAKTIIDLVNRVLDKFDNGERITGREFLELSHLTPILKGENPQTIILNALTVAGARLDFLLVYRRKYLETRKQLWPESNDSWSGEAENPDEKHQ